MNRILLFSSGLDSFVAWHYLDKPNCLHLTGHSRYSQSELAATLKIKKKHPDMDLTIIDTNRWLQKFEEHDANIPLRNAHFALAASHFGDTVYMPCQLGEQSIPDRSPEFFKLASDMLSYLKGTTVTLDPVFPSWTKQDMVRWYLSKGLPKEDLWDTYSCFSDNQYISRLRCGECPACFRTAVALDYNSILPDNFFTKDIWKWEGIAGYVERLHSGEYEITRAKQTIEVLAGRELWK